MARMLHCTLLFCPLCVCTCSCPLVHLPAPPSRCQGSQGLWDSIVLEKEDEEVGSIGERRWGGKENQSIDVEEGFCAPEDRAMRYVLPRGDVCGEHTCCFTSVGYTNEWDHYWRMIEAASGALSAVMKSASHTHSGSQSVSHTVSQSVQ